MGNNNNTKTENLNNNNNSHKGNFFNDFGDIFSKQTNINTNSNTNSNNSQNKNDSSKINIYLLKNFIFKKSFQFI
jgi:hypothetical protein